MIRVNKFFVSLLLLVILIMGISIAQETEQNMEQLEMKIDLAYSIDSDDTKIFAAHVTALKDKQRLPVQGINIEFYAGNGNEISFDKIQTNTEGQAILNISKDFELPKNSEGQTILRAVFTGNEVYEASESEITIIEVQMELSLSETGTIKTITINASEIHAEGEEVPLEEVDVYFYVTRLFGLLEIGDGWMEEGQCSIEFPNDLPGDSIGNVTIIAKLEDSELYGNIEKRVTVQWGIPVSYELKEPEGELWTSTAPLWMVICLIALITSVWAHYIFLFYNMYRIRKNGKKI